MKKQYVTEWGHTSSAYDSPEQALDGAGCMFDDGQPIAVYEVKLIGMYIRLSEHLFKPVEPKKKPRRKKTRGRK